jgi:DNA gyrase/topoisomerase IV subunit A
MDYQKDIIDILDKALVEKTFDLEIVSKIKQLKDEHVNALKSIESLSKQIVDKDKLYSDVRAELDKALKLNEEYRAREREISKAEREAEKKDLEMKFQKERGNEIKEMFMHVFRNPSIVRNKTMNIPVASNGYVSTQPGSEFETESIGQ